MKLRNVISVVLLFVYGMLTVTGIGVSYCNCTQSQQLVMLAVHTACPQCSKKADTRCSHSDGHHHDEKNDCKHDDDCCSFSIQYVDVDRLNFTNLNNSPSKSLTLFSLPAVVQIAGVSELSVFVKNNSPPPDLLKIPLIYLHRQLRL